MVCGQSPQQTLATKSEKLAYKDHWGRLTILTRNRSVKERLQVVWFPRLPSATQRKQQPCESPVPAGSLI